VATHLGRVFKKLGVRSREQVAELFADQERSQGSA
jgi:DNA-binding CsgD family transcriptional regulator